MAHKPPQTKSAHDKGVQSWANRYKKDGWRVDADIAGWPAPALIGGRQPDVVAVKNGYAHIIEVETNRGDDHDQHATFRRHVGQKPRSKFILVIVDRAGRTKEVLP
jgi:hypothetical protein